MLKTPLSLLVVATQLLSWNASPLYLCLDSDGACCVDFGPATCGCCHDEAAVACCHDTACEEHSHREEQPRGDGDPCGCDHVQITEPQVATRSSKADVDQQQVSAAHFAAVTPCSIWRVASCSSAAEALDSGPPALSAALAERASVVLRC